MADMASIGAVTGNATQAADAAKLDALRRTVAKSRENPEELKKACRDFEALFIHQLLQAMRKTVPVSDFLGEDKLPQEIFRDMLDVEYGKQMASTGTLGIADLLYKQMSQALPDAAAGHAPRGGAVNGKA